MGIWFSDDANNANAENGLHLVIIHKTAINQVCVLTMALMLTALAGIFIDPLAH